jgi:IPT/TIG domain
MSSLVYGIVNAKRAAAPAGKSQTTAAPAMNIYIDALAALVPAEALVLYAAIVIPNTTNAVPVGGKKATVISDPNLMRWSCVGLLVLSAALYIVGRSKKNAKLTGWDVPKFLIPPAAFAAWMLVQNPSVWDIWWHGSSTAERVVIAAFAAVAIGILASALGYQVDQAPGALIVADVSPESGSVAGGDSVTVTGSGFTGATGVKFGMVPAEGLDVSGDTQLTVTSPPANASEMVHVTVTTPKGTSATSASDQFIYTNGGNN